ncbi:MAG: heavy-metal-associated domain-containing protein [Clostridia bacterium]|nr:heavy-metal-associated domain-containing protein [Clostridia bacterium]
MDTTVFNVPSLSCSICSNKIQEGLKSMNGVQDVSVDMKSQTVTIGYDASNIQPADIRKTISSMGYEVIQ